MEHLLRNHQGELVVFERTAVFLSLPFLLCMGPMATLAAEAGEVSGGSTLDFANGLYARKMFGPAIEEYRKFIDSNPASNNTASAYFRMADSHFFIKEYAKSIEMFQHYLSAYPQDERVPTALFRVGTAFYYLGDMQSARRIFFQISKSKGDDNIQAGSFFYLAKVYHAEQKLEKALLVLHRVLLNYPQTEYAGYAGLYAGDLFSEALKQDEALGMYNRVAGGEYPANVVRQAQLKSADTYFKTQKYSDAGERYRQIYDAQKSTKEAPPEFSDKERKLYFERVLAGLLRCYYYEKNFSGAKSLLAENENFLVSSAVRQDLYFLVAVLSSENHDNEQALVLLERILGDAQTTAEMKAKALFKKSAVLNAMDRKEEALLILQGISQGASDKDAAKAYYERAQIFRESGRNEEARKDFEAYLARYEEGEEVERATLQLAQIEIDAESFHEAENRMHVFLKKFPKSRFTDIAQYKLGMALAGSKKFLPAAKALQRVLEISPDSVLAPSAIYAVAVSFESAGDFTKSIEFYEKFVGTYREHSLRATALVRLGFLYIQSRLYSQAAKLYSDLLLKEPAVSIDSSTALWVIRYYLDHKEYENMKELLQELPKHYPGEDLRHEVNFFLAESLMGQKNYTESAEYYAKAVQVKPDGMYAAHSYLGIGLAHATSGRVAEAEAAFTKALSYDGEVFVSLRARFEMANLNLKRGDLDTAAKAFMHVAILYDDEKYCPVALFKAGECFDKLGKSEEAERAFSEILTRYPKDKWARRAEVYLKKMEAVA